MTSSSNKPTTKAGGNGAAANSGAAAAQTTNNTPATTNQPAATAGAQSSVGIKAAPPVMPTTSAVGGAGRISPAQAVMGGTVPTKLNLGRMPNVAGFSKNKAGRKGSEGIKRAFYAIFCIVYADWTKWAKFIAKGQMVNIFVDGTERTIENRVWIVCDAVGNVVDRLTLAQKNSIGTGAEDAYILPAGCGVRPYSYPDESVNQPWGVSFVKNADLAEWFNKRAAETLLTNPERSAEFTEYAKSYGESQKYGGYVCCEAKDIAAATNAVREYYRLNPESQNTFVELPIFQPVYLQDGLEAINNDYYATTAEGIAAAEAATLAAAATTPNEAEATV